MAAARVGGAQGAAATCGFVGGAGTVVVAKCHLSVIEPSIDHLETLETLGVSSGSIH